MLTNFEEIFLQKTSDYLAFFSPFRGHSVHFVPRDGSNFTKLKQLTSHIICVILVYIVLYSNNLPTNPCQPYFKAFRLSMQFF